jgi:hypothetical protein
MLTMDYKKGTIACTRTTSDLLGAAPARKEKYLAITRPALSHFLECMLYLARPLGGRESQEDYTRSMRRGGVRIAPERESTTHWDAAGLVGFAAWHYGYALADSPRIMS